MGLWINIKKGNGAQPYYFNIVSNDNYKEIARSSEMYASKPSAVHAAQLVKKSAGTATMFDEENDNKIID